jgi:hypothetical protein
MKNKAKYVSRIKWFCITVIITVLAAIILPDLLPFFPSKVCARSLVHASTAKSLIGRITKMQQGYYLEHGHFASSKQQLELVPDRELRYTENIWEISIQIKDDIAFAYAVAKYTDPNQKFYSYVAATTAYGKPDNYQWTRTICRTLEPSTAQPAAPMLQESQQFIFWRHDAKLVCSSSTEDC